MPTPKPRSWPRFFQPAASLATSARISSAIRTAASSGSSTGSGSLNRIITPSPAKCSTVPSCASTMRPSTAWYSRSTPITSSGSAVSENAVKPRRSVNTTVMSRRCVFSGSSTSPATISSPTRGETKRFRRARRSISPTCSATRFSRLALRLVISSCSAFTRSSDFTRANSSGWLTGLERKSSAPASMPLTRSCCGSSEVHITTGSSAVAGFSRMRRQTS